MRFAFYFFNLIHMLRTTFGILLTVFLLIAGACQTVTEPEQNDSEVEDSEEVVTPGVVREFSMDSFMNENNDGSRVAGFSRQQIIAKKGDTVRINVNNTSGTHDFTLDEFGVKKETPEGEVTVVEFVADKTGEFKYYCSKYDHRQLGQEGTLIVEE